MRLRRKMIVPALAAAAAGSLFAAAALRAQPPKAAGKGEMMMAGSSVTKAIAVLHPTKSGGEASGVVTFTKVDGGVRVEAEIRGLTPGEHGFHIHEFGDSSSPDAMSAGGHFNPAKSEHGAMTAAKRHVGDLGNITASARGVARLDVVDPNLAFSGLHNILGRGLIVHEKADDLKTQPTGNAGGRVAVGVIGVAKPN
jgi:Cu-Zn family superoxide dismutase